MGCSTFNQTPRVSTVSSYYRLAGSTTKFLAIDENGIPHIVDTSNLKSSTYNCNYNPKSSDFRIYLLWTTSVIYHAYANAIGTSRINNGLVRYLASESTHGTDTHYTSTTPLCYIKIPEDVTKFYFQQTNGTDELGNTIYYSGSQFNIQNVDSSTRASPGSITEREFEAVDTPPEIQYYSSARGLVYPNSYLNGVFTNGDVDIIFGYGIDYYNTQYFGVPALNIISYSPSMDDPWVYYNIVRAYDLDITCNYVYSPVIVSSPSITLTLVDANTIILDSLTLTRTATMKTTGIPSDLKSLIPTDKFTILAPGSETTPIVKPGPANPGYDIIVVAGQSNALGVYSTANSIGAKFDVTPDNDIFMLKRNANWSPYSTSTNSRLHGINPSSPVDSFSASVDGIRTVDDPGSDIGGGLSVKLAREPTVAETADQRVFCCINFALKFCKDYKNNNKLAVGRKVLLVHVAQGKTALTSISQYSVNKAKKSDDRTGVSWNKNEADSGNLRNLVTNTVTSLLSLNRSNRVVCFLWQQGEEDAEINSSEQTYRDALTELVSDFRSAAGDANVPFLAGGFTKSYQDTATTGKTSVMNALKNPGISRYYYVGDGKANNLEDDNASTFAGGLNGIHYNANGQFGLAALYTAAYNSI